MADSIRNKVPSRIDLLARLDKGVTLESGLGLVLLKSLLPGIVLSAIASVFLGPYGALLVAVIPVFLTIEFLVSRRRGRSVPLVIKYYQLQLRSEVDFPVDSLQAYFSDIRFTKACFRGLCCIDTRYGWDYFEVIVGIATRQERHLKWELLNELLLFIYQVEEDADFQRQLGEKAAKLYEMYRISFSVAPPPGLSDLDQASSVKPSTSTATRIGHDIAIYDAGGEMIYMAPLQLSGWVNIASGTFLERYRFRNRLSDEEIVKEISLELLVHTEYLEQLKSIPLPPAVEPKAG